MIILDSYHVHVISTEKATYERHSTATTGGRNLWANWSKRVGTATNYIVQALELQESELLEKEFRIDLHRSKNELAHTHLLVFLQDQ